MGPAQDLFGQLWKEYALSDSRYLTSDAFVLCMETVTAVRLLLFRLVLTLKLTTFLVHLGPNVLHYRSLHHNLTPTPSPSPDHRLRRTNIRPDPVLCHLDVRSLLHGDHILASGSPVLLGILLLHELHLDGFPWQ